MYCNVAVGMVARAPRYWVARQRPSYRHHHRNFSPENSKKKTFCIHVSVIVLKNFDWSSLQQYLTISLVYTFNELRLPLCSPINCIPGRKYRFTSTSSGSNCDIISSKLLSLYTEPIGTIHLGLKKGGHPHPRHNGRNFGLGSVIPCYPMLKRNVKKLVCDRILAQKLYFTVPEEWSKGFSVPPKEVVLAQHLHATCTLDIYRDRPEGKCLAPNDFDCAHDRHNPSSERCG